MSVGGSDPITVAVIGGGIIGTSIAWRLAQQGAKVCVFEKTLVGLEASWAAAGMLSPGGESDQCSERARLFVESRQLFPGFVAELGGASGLPIDYRECGAVDLAYGDAEWAKLKTRAARQAECGIASRTLTAQQLNVLSPHVNLERLQGALFYKGDAVVAPRDLMAALRAACVAQNVDIRENSPIAAVNVDRDGVVAGAERFSCAVIASGAWSGQIELRGAPPLPPSNPVKGHLLAFDLPLGACPTIVRREHLYLFQRGSGLTVVGASVEHVGFDRSVDTGVAARLRQDAVQVFPILDKLKPVDVWTGLRPASEQLQLGRWQGSPVFLAYGHYRNGILLAPLTAQRIASEIMSNAKP